MPRNVRLRTRILILATLICIGLGVWGGSAFAGVYLAMATVGAGALAIPVIVGISRSAEAERARSANYARSRVATPPVRESVDVAILSQNRDSLVRTYRAPSLDGAQILFRQDAAAQSLVGWSPASQSWAEGSPGVGRVLAIGLLAFAARPKGTLTVMYRRTS